MPRRVLTVYAIMYTAGISAGYFMFEKLRVAEAFGFIAASCAAVILAGSTHERSVKQSFMFMAVLFAGFISFSLRYGVMESEVSMWSGREAVISGRVISAVTKDDRLDLIVRPDSRGMPRKVKLMLGDHSAHPPSDTDGNTLYTKAYELTGTTITAEGEFREPAGADDPGVFDQRLYLRAGGTPLTFRARWIEVNDEGGGLASFRRCLFGTREDFVSLFDEETAGFIRGAVFGDKRELDEDMVKEFNANSTGHILAVSGLHMGFLYTMLRILSGRKRTAGVSAAIIALMTVYGEMTLWSPSTIRACIVMSLSLLSVQLRRPFDLLTSVSLAALIILAVQPYQLFDTGFRMSFLAMAGIAFLTKPVSSVTGERLGMMLAVQAGTVPVTAYTFCRFNPLAVFINIPVIFLASLLVPLCLLMLICGMLLGTFPQAGIKAAELMAYALIRVNHLLSFDGGFSFRAAGFGAAAVVIIYAVLFGLSSEWARVRFIRKEHAAVTKSAAILMIPLLMMCSCLYDSFYDDEVVFVSVGQGDCTHIRAAGRDVLIDGGGRDDFNTGERMLMPYLLREGCDALDMALVTHLHEDHYRGICELAAVFPVGIAGIPSDYSEVLNSGTGPFGPERLFPVEPGSRVNITDDVHIDTIWPVRAAEAAISEDDPNEHNSVYMINYRGVRIMVTGDLLEEDEHEMLEYYRKRGREDAIRCDVLKVAHHGSKSSSSEEFLDAAAPAVAVISAGRNNIYGHPHSLTLERLEERGIAVYRTDIHGAVGLDIRKSRVKVDVMRPSFRSGQS